MGEWEYGAERRREYWSEVGEVSSLALFGPTNGIMSPWPGKAENFVPVVTPDSVIITTDGLSSPWEVSAEGEPLDAGERLELYIDCAELSGPLDPHALMGEPRLRMVVAAAVEMAGKHYRPTFDHYGVLALRIPNRSGPDEWSDTDGHLNLLFGVPARGRSDYVQFWDDAEAVRMIAVTPIRPDEAEWMRGAGSREELADLLAASPTGNRVDFRRPSVLADAEPPAPDAPFIHALRLAVGDIAAPWERAILVVRLGTPASALCAVQYRPDLRPQLSPDKFDGAALIRTAEEQFKAALQEGRKPWIVGVFGSRPTGRPASALIDDTHPEFSSWVRPLTDAQLLDAGWDTLEWPEP